jgi:hypothetical protein
LRSVQHQHSLVRLRVVVCPLDVPCTSTPSTSHLLHCCLYHGATTLSVLPLSQCCSLTPLPPHSPEGASSQSCPHRALPRRSASSLTVLPPHGLGLLQTIDGQVLLPSQCPPYSTAFSQCGLSNSVAPLIALPPFQCSTSDSAASVTVFNLSTSLSIK